MLIVAFRTMGAYEAMARRLFFANRNVKRFRSFIAMERVKVGLIIALEPQRDRS
ncbi:AsnC family transcriptional regulator [Rhizobium lentis]|uniref:Uncharacterized protein n=1 Tax=Rhizobium lentis TaxID=1138194 RepID=A0A7W8XJJ7_9HYPH|nr:hypothetical protein [Rhizobium lentis]MBB5553351.1 hypothetical protein [Rhizobium lentis]MBB5564083.1 hypothetical protein [Rhizobium lentis]MBB5570495.1 hypothetical protein [Rhizobium lentis]